MNRRRVAPSGGAVAGRAPRAPRAPRAAHAPAARPAAGAPHGERGSQALELALCIPLVALLLAGVLTGGLVAAELVVVQGLAREAARAVAVGEPPEPVVRSVGGPAATVRVTRTTAPGGALARVDVAVPSRAAGRLGLRVALPGSATMRVETGS